MIFILFFKKKIIGERAMRNKINQTFENFVKKVDEQVQEYD